MKKTQQKEAYLNEINKRKVDIARDEAFSSRMKYYAMIEERRKKYLDGEIFADPASILNFKFNR